MADVASTRNASPYAHQQTTTESLEKTLSARGAPGKLSM
jgi:hypothetical protein